MPKVRTKRTQNVKCIPYASGYVPPTNEEQIKAVGYDCFVPPEYNCQPDKDFNFFKPIPTPTSIDDWLAQYVDPGQSFADYLSTCSWLSPSQVRGINQKFVPTGRNLCEKYPEGKIYLLPIGKFSAKGFVHFNELAKFAEIYLGIPVVILNGIEIDVNFTDKKVYWTKSVLETSSYGESSKLPNKTALESRFYGKHRRYQIGIASLLYMLRQNIPKDALSLIGLTMSDLYREQSDLFVAGWAAGGDHVAVFSFFRYDPSLTFSNADWYNIRRNRRMSQEHIQKLTFHRSCKLLVHEIGHLLGIGHCIFFECCMNGSGHLAEDFRQPMHLCPVDLHKLQTLVGFNVLTRYENLLKFYQHHVMKDEAEWISRRFDFIKNAPVEII
ncbi:amzA [Mytilus coruscus]|uniref:AmzA n=1 Tax=Mytilus coruscus TaxID=42192 RepID=A0A6J8DA27_MYTCO|nr:amzA [Mytilus coruscus]